MPSTIVLGIDASLRGTGLAVIEAAGSTMRCLHWEVVRMPAKAPHSQCLKTIRNRIDELVAAYTPAAASMEGGFYFKNGKVALVLGEVRGVAISSCAVAGVPVFEYSPRSAKQNITGWGAAPKDQVARMVASMLALREAPPDDATDAMALALCHLQTNRTYFPAEPI